jgi:hypothetical protein
MCGLVYSCSTNFWVRIDCGHFLILLHASDIVILEYCWRFLFLQDRFCMCLVCITIGDSSVHESQYGFLGVLIKPTKIDVGAAI